MGDLGLPFLHNCKENFQDLGEKFCRILSEEDEEASF